MIKLKNQHTCLALFSCALVALLTLPILAQKNYTIDNIFLNKIHSLDSISRSSKLNELVGSEIRGEATIQAVRKSEHFNSAYLVEAMFKSGSIELNYNLYTNDQSFTKLDVIGKKIAFEGRLVLITDIDLRRRLFVLDVILTEGTLIVD